MEKAKKEAIAGMVIGFLLAFTGMYLAFAKFDVSRADEGLFKLVKYFAIAMIEGLGWLSVAYFAMKYEEYKDRIDRDIIDSYLKQKRKSDHDDDMELRPRNDKDSGVDIRILQDRSNWN